ncbi:expressed unknown protein [Seminavis robusta]|uniref:CRAL-TRIO domain-containing protein n=1 Tax=Seminavis robusta TaxID=568900 RepID=A0A9N8ESX5_9STRA|nr:expressed unknown protein [Seminavis robusta]|eukprot:Sro1852_g301740.1 n/a (362) ;mRNA; f:11048-12133
MQAADQDEDVLRHDDGSNQGRPQVPDGLDRQQEQVMADDANVEAVAAAVNGGPNDENHQENENENDDAHDDSDSSESEEEEDQEDGANRAGPAAVELPVGPSDHRRMQLNNEEHQWALNIKQAIEDEPELDSVSDFWVAQLALIDQGDTAAALERAHKMQGFRQEYGILDTYEHGRHVIHEIMDIFPKLYLSFGFSHRYGTYVLVLDVAKLYAKTLNTRPGAMAAWLSAEYYVYNCMSPDLEAIRTGIVSIVECEGFEWSKHFGLQIMKKFSLELGAVYPFQVKQLLCYHTGLCFTLLMSMVKQYLPATLRSTISVGNICGLGRLDALYFSPGVEFARDMIKTRLEECLDRRYRNEASFSL